MRKSFTVSLVFVAMLAVAIPTTAAPRAPLQQRTAVRERNMTPITRVVRMIKRVFGVESQGNLVIPTPDQPPTDPPTNP